MKRRPTAEELKRYAAELGVAEEQRKLFGKGKAAKFFKVTWYSPQLQKRVGPPQLFEAHNRAGAIAEAKVAIGYAVLKKRKLPLPANFMATESSENPARLANVVPFFCSDCDAELKGKSVQLKDRRHICTKCARKLVQTKSQKAQRSLFVEQKPLFENTTRNVEMGYVDPYGTFHPIRASKDYNEFKTTDLERPDARRKRTVQRQALYSREYNDQMQRAEKARLKDLTTRAPKRRTGIRSLSQYVRRRGGIAPGKMFTGELRRLGRRESGTTGLLNQHARTGSQKMTAEYMMDAANEEGYRDSHGARFEAIGDFLSAVEADASGHKKLYSHEDLDRMSNSKKNSTKKRKRISIVVRVKANRKEKNTRVAVKAPRRPAASAKSPGRARGGKANPQSKLTSAQLAHLRSEFEKLDKVNLQKHRTKFYEVFAGVRSPLLKQLADAKIEWVSGLARNAYMRRLRNPAAKQKNMHALEVGSHVAMILSGLETVRRIVGSKAKNQKRKAAKKIPAAKNARKNLGLISLVENIQAADYLTSKLKTKKRKNSAGLAKPVVIVGRYVNAVITKKAGQKFVGQIVQKQGKGVHMIRGRAFTLFLTLPGAKKWGRAQIARFNRAAENPAKAKAKRANPNNGKIFEEFTGNKSSHVETGYVWPAPAPKNVDQLGKLTEIHLSNPGSRLDPARARCGRAGSGQCGCRRVLTFTRNPAKLCATQQGDGTRRLIIALRQPFDMPRQLNPAAPHDYGEVHTICYRAPKPHLYHHNREIDFYHDLGEEGGRRPHLILQNGLLKLSGGDYKIQREGIRD